MLSRVKTNRTTLTGVCQLFWLIYFALTLCLVGSLLAYGVVVPLFLLGIVFPKATKWAEFVLCRGIRLLMMLQPWFKAEINFVLPSGGKVLLVSNHRSHLDAFILLSQFCGIKILAKKSLFSFPGIGFIMRISKQIPLKGSEVDLFLSSLEVVRGRLKMGELVHVFPELTRCEEGFIGTREFSVAPFRIAFQEKCSVLPIIFKGTDSAWAKGELGLRFRRLVISKSLAVIDSQDFTSAFELRDEVQSRMRQALL